MSDQATLRTIEKLGHGLAEVRHRALSQIRTKEGILIELL